MISILLPTFRAEKWIRRALDSIVFQYFDDYEIIVCDNLSGDNMQKICKRYTNVKFYSVKQEVDSWGYAIKNCWDRCSGDVIGTIGADDELLPGSLRRISKEFENKDIDWVYSKMRMWKDDKEVDSIGEPNVDFDKMLYKMSIPICSSFFRRDVIERYGFLDYKKFRMCDDYEFMLRLLLNGVQPKFIEETTKFHITGENYSFVNKDTGNEELFKLKKDYSEIKKSRDIERENLEPQKIALVTFATGKDYWPFAKEMISSAREYLKHNFDVFLFTDSENFGEGVNVIPLEQHPWPLPTLMRYHSILGYEEEFKEYDFIFLIDSDMRFVKDVRDILSDGITATIRGMYDVRRGLRPPYEPNEQSAAYVKPFVYYAGGFIGGRRERFLDMARVISENIDKDLDKGYMAIWNEESHLNKYLMDNPPERTLDVSYCYPETMNDYYRAIWGRDYEPKIIDINKIWKFSDKEKNYNKKVISDFVPSINKFYAKTE